MLWLISSYFDRLLRSHLWVLVAVLSCATSAQAMSSNYPKLDGRTVEGLVLEQGNYDDDDEVEIVIENRWLRVVIEPEHGGTLSSVYEKTQQLELTKRSVNGDWGGLFRNVIDGNPAKRDWYMAPFQVKVVRHTEQLVVVELSAAGKSGAYTGVTLTKRFTLTADSSRLKVDYKIYNNPVSVEPLPFAMRVHSGVGVAGRKGQLFWPVERGMFRQEQPGGHYIWEPNPTRGFCGYATDEGEGLAFRMEYRLLRQFYYWADHGTLPRSTLEWYMNELPVPAGGSVETSIYVLPFAGIVDPSGVTDEVVGKIDTSTVTEPNKPGDVTFRLASTVTGQRQMIVRSRRLPDGEPTVVSDQVIALQAGDVVAFSNPVSVPEPGTYEMILELRNDGRPAGTLLSPMIVQRAHVPYTVAPLEERYAPLAVKMLPRDFTFASQDVVTPHIPWAKQYAGGSTSFFLIADGYVQREAVELAQRFDMEPASSFLTPQMQWATYALGGFEGRISEQDLIGQLEKEFAAQKSMDAILLSGSIWQWMTPWMRGNVIERVQAGAGLVWLGPSHAEGAIAEALPIAPFEDVNSIVAPIHSVGDHFITRGIPWPLVAGMRVQPTQLTENGHAIASMQTKDKDYPVIAISQFGKGRIVAMTASVKPTPYSGHNITPHRLTDPDHHNHEYDLSLVARALIWASGHESKTVLNVSASKSNLDVAITSFDQKEASLEVTFRDRYSQVVHKVTQPISLTAGESKITIAIPVLPNGINAAECILRSDGLTLDWHTVAIDRQRSVNVDSFAADNIAYEEGSPVVLTAKISGKTDGLRLRITLRDAFDRTVLQQTIPVAEETVTAKPDVPRPSSLRLYAFARLLDTSGNVIDVDRAYVDYRHVMQPNDMLVSFGFQGVSQYGTPPYLMKPFYEALIRAGSNGWFHKPGHNIKEELDATRAANLPIQLASGPLHPGKTVIGKHLRAKYIETGDPIHLRRAPLIGEAFDAQLRSTVEQQSQIPSIQWGAFDFYNGDESIYQPNDIDLSFDPVTLPIFRDWLKEKYGSLEALNAEWRTAFAAWPEVMPMTREAVVSHPSWAPWLEHRQFGDYVFARAYRMARQHIDELLPGMRSGASGTGNTEAGMGWNWWLMRDAFASLQPYGGDQTYQQRAFMLDVPQTGWMGYGVLELDRYMHKLWRWLSFGSMRGINLFSGRNNVNPDLTLPLTAKAFREALDTAAKGQARALFLAKPVLDPIAFHYSPRSLWTAIPFGMRTQRQASSDGMTNLLNDANLQYDYVAYEQVENGILDQGRHRMLFLRASTAISDKEAESIRRFVKAGGVVIADLLPGVLNENGSVRSSAALDDVFGVKQQGQVVSGKGTFDVDGEVHGISMGKLHVEIESATPMSLTSATGLGKWQIEGQSGPALAVNQYGKGIAVYLGCDLLAGYTSARLMRHMERGQQLLAGFDRLRRSLLKAASIDHVVKLTDAQGELVRANVFRLEGDSISFVSVLGNNVRGDIVPAKLHLAKPAHVFDLFTGERIGSGLQQTVDLQFDPEFACHILTLLEAMPGKLSVNAPPRASRGGSVRIDVSIPLIAGTPKDYALRVETTRPDGDLFHPLTRNATARDGKMTLWFDVALDDLPGAYQVSVRNVITGDTDKTSIVVE